MKVCFSSFTCPQWTLAQVLNAAQGYGYHGVELRCDAHHKHGVEIDTSIEQRAQINETIRQHGIEAVCLSSSVQMAHAHSDEILIGRIDLAADTGFQSVRVLCGQNEDDMTVADSIDLAVPRLRRAAAHAEQRGINVLVETHDSIGLAVNAAALVRHVEHERVGLLYNNLHPYRLGESVVDSFEAMGSLIRHVHFHDGIKDPEQVIVTPMGKGQLPLDEMFIALLRTGYDGYLSGEWFHDQYGHTSDESLVAYMKDVTRLCQHHGVRLEQAL